MCPVCVPKKSKKRVPNKYNMLCDEILPEGVVREQGPPTKPPEDYSKEGYVLPVHSEKPLQRLNMHPLDKRLTFYEKPHVYTFDDTPTSTSVTSLAHQFERPFDGPVTIAGMRTPKRQAWPRLEYTVDPQPATERSWRPGLGALLHWDGNTIAAVQPHNLTSVATQEDLMAVLQAATLKRYQDTDFTEDPLLYTFEREETEEEILNKWTAKGQLASAMGTEAHWLAECYFNGVPTRWWDPEMQIVTDFARTHLAPRGIVGFNTEKEIVCQDADVAGSIDLLLYEPSKGIHHILDFKRSDKLSQQMTGFVNMKAPLNHLQDCKGAAYALQTSIYQYILERDYGMTFGDRILLSIHPDNPYFTSVPYLRAEVEFIMQNRFNLVKARRAARDAHPEKFTCALTGAPLFEAVKLEDSRMVMEKAALAKEMPYTVDESMREAFEAEVATHMVDAVLDRKRCTSWRHLAPAPGSHLPLFV